MSSVLDPTELQTYIHDGVPCVHVPKEVWEEQCRRLERIEAVLKILPQEAISVAVAQAAGHAGRPVSMFLPDDADKQWFEELVLSIFNEHYDADKKKLLMEGKTIDPTWLLCCLYYMLAQQGKLSEDNTLSKYQDYLKTILPAKSFKGSTKFYECYAQLRQLDQPLMQTKKSSLIEWEDDTHRMQQKDLPKWKEIHSILESKISRN